MPVRGLAIFIALALSLVAVCGETASPAAAKVTCYDARGVLKSLDPKNRQVTISHEKIPGYMDAMIMSFTVRDFSQLPKLQPGDAIAFRLNVTADNAWIDQVTKIAGEKAAPLLEPAPPGVVRELAEGDVLPDIALENERGKKIAVSNFRGRALAITFIYSRCPLPTYCPLINRNFVAAQDLLTRIDADGKWSLLSISLDPDFDTPTVLAAEAKAYHADAEHWTFATGSEEEVRKFGSAVGLEFNLKAGQINHNLRTVVVDGEGHIRHIFRGNSWTPQELAAEIRSAIPRR